MSQVGLNRVTLVGRLTRDCELRYTDGGMAICNFSIAVGYRRKQGDQWVEEVSYFDSVCFGKRGESVSRYLTKGKQIGVDGELRQNRWEQDGKARSKVEVIVQNVQFLGTDRDQSSSAGGAPAPPQHASPPSAPPPPSGAAPPPPPAAAADSFEDDIPF